MRGQGKLIRKGYRKKPCSIDKKLEKKIITGKGRKDKKGKCYNTNLYFVTMKKYVFIRKILDTTMYIVRKTFLYS